jgi:hypothetical protein
MLHWLTRPEGAVAHRPHNARAQMNDAKPLTPHGKRPPGALCRACTLHDPHNDAQRLPAGQALSSGPVRRRVVPATLAMRLPAWVKRVALWA